MIPFDELPIVCSSCFWMFTSTSGRTMKHGWPERRRIPDSGSGGRATARISRASAVPIVDTDVCRTCDTKPCLYVCPSKVYRLDKGELVYNTEGCIELGACAIVCKHLGKNAIHWNYPRGSYGVEFRFG